MNFLIFSNETKFYDKTLRVFDDFVNFLLISMKNIIMLDKIFQKQNNNTSSIFLNQSL